MQAWHRHATRQEDHAVENGRALFFQHLKESRKHGKAGVKQWIEEIKVELPKRYNNKYGQQLLDIPPDVLQQMAARASTVFVDAFLHTRKKQLPYDSFHATD